MSDSGSASGEEQQRGSGWGRWGVPAKPFQTLPSKIVSSVFAAALIASLAVTWISTGSIESFLRDRIDQKFPAILRSGLERLDLWYSQRQLDVEAFARSSTLVDNLARIGGGTRGARAREDLEKYLGYVLEQFPQYRALFVLDREGLDVLWVGADFTLTDPHLAELAVAGSPRVGDVHLLEGERVQVASAPVLDAGGARVASLHAVIDVAALEALLQNDDLSASGSVYVVGVDGTVLFQTPGTEPRARWDRPFRDSAPDSVVEDYVHSEGLHVVGSTMPFTRFQWTIVVEEEYDPAFAPMASLIREVLTINLGIVVLFSLIAFQIARSIVRPIRALSEGADRIASGETGVEIETSDAADELGILTRAIRDMMARLQRNQVELEEKRVQIEDANQQLIAQNEELRRVNEVFQQLSITDELTRLHNHRFFQDHLPREMKRSARTGEPLALILIDIDDFKMLNDRFGHAVGDLVLSQAADVMNAVVRDMDLLARYGGEEFALLASQTTLKGAVSLAEKIRLAISETRFEIADPGGPAEVTITVSIGVAAFNGDEKGLFNDADRALYRAKDAGKDCVVVWDEAAEARG